MSVGNVSFCVVVVADANAGPATDEKMTPAMKAVARDMLPKYLVIRC